VKCPSPTGTSLHCALPSVITFCRLDQETLDHMKSIIRCKSGISSILEMRTFGPSTRWAGNGGRWRRLNIIVRSIGYQLSHALADKECDGRLYRVRNVPSTLGPAESNNKQSTWRVIC
jgi:hypothetical protein